MKSCDRREVNTAMLLARTIESWVNKIAVDKFFVLYIIYAIKRCKSIQLTMESTALTGSARKRYRKTQSSYCAAANCYNSRTRRPNLSFFRIANDAERFVISTLLIFILIVSEAFPTYQLPRCFKVVLTLNPNLNPRIDTHLSLCLQL